MLNLPWTSHLFFKTARRCTWQHWYQSTGYPVVFTSTFTLFSQPIPGLTVFFLYFHSRSLLNGFLITYLLPLMLVMTSFLHILTTIFHLTLNLSSSSTLPDLSSLTICISLNYLFRVRSSSFLSPSFNLSLNVNLYFNLYFHLHLFLKSHLQFLHTSISKGFPISLLIHKVIFLSSFWRLFFIVQFLVSVCFTPTLHWATQLDSCSSC